MPYKDPAVRKEYLKRYHEAHREEHSAAMAQHYREHRDEYISNSHAWYAANKERASATQKAYKLTNKNLVRQWQRARRAIPEKRERHNDLNRQSYLRTKPHKAAYKRRYSSANRAKIAKTNAVYYLENKERILARNTKWWSEHPEHAIKYQNQRRAAIESAPGSHTADDIKAIWERQKHKCAVKGCLYPITDVKGDPAKYHVDRKFSGPFEPRFVIG